MTFYSAIWKLVRAALAFLFLVTLVAAAPEKCGSRLKYIPQSALALVNLNEGKDAAWAGVGEIKAFLDSAAAWLRVDAEKLKKVFIENGCTGALLPALTAEKPAVLLVFSGGKEEVCALFSSWEDKAAKPGSDGPYHLPAPVNLTFHCRTVGDVLLLATEIEVLEKAMQAAARPDETSVLVNREIKQASARIKDGGLLLSIRSTLLPAESPLLAMVGKELSRLTWTACAAGGENRETLQLKWHGGPTGPTDYLLPGPLQADFLGFDPEGSILTMVGNFTPKVIGRAEFKKIIAARVALPWDQLSEVLSGQMAVSLTPGGGLVGMLGLQDQTKADRVLRSFRAQSEKVSEAVCCGYTIYTVNLKKGESGPAWLFSGGNLFISSNPADMEKLVPVISGTTKSNLEPATEGLRLKGDTMTVANLLGGLPERCLSRMGTELKVKARVANRTLSLDIRASGNPSALVFLEEFDFPVVKLAKIEPVKPQPILTPANKKLGGMTEEGKYNLLVELEKEGLNPDTTRDVAYLLHDKSKAVASRAAYLLGLLEVKGVAPQLAAVLVGDGPAQVKQYCAYALMRVPDQRAEKSLIKALGETNAQTTGLAATALSRLNSKQAALPLANALLRHEKAEVTSRLRILNALGRIGSPECFGRVLMSCKGIEHEKLVTALVYFFQEMTPDLQPAREVDFLSDLLDYPCPELRRYAAERLGQLDGEVARKRIQGRIAHETAETRPGLQNVLTALAKPAAAPEPTVAKTLHQQAAGWKEQFSLLVQQIKGWPNWKKGILVCLPLLGIAFILVIRSLLKRNSRQRLAQDISGLVAPSEGACESSDWEDEEMLVTEDDEGIDEDNWEVELDDNDEVEQLIPSASEDEFFANDGERD